MPSERTCWVRDKSLSVGERNGGLRATISTSLHHHAVVPGGNNGTERGHREVGCSKRGNLREQQVLHLLWGAFLQEPANEPHTGNTTLLAKGARQMGTAVSLRSLLVRLPATMQYEQNSLRRSQSRSMIASLRMALRHAIAHHLPKE